jgi:hypothetical protein
MNLSEIKKYFYAQAAQISKKETQKFIEDIIDKLFSVKILKECYLYSGLTQPPAHGQHGQKRKRKVRITEFLTKSNNKGRWSATTKQSPGGEALVGLEKATSMRKYGAM